MMIITPTEGFRIMRIFWIYCIYFLVYKSNVILCFDIVFFSHYEIRNFQKRKSARFNLIFSSNHIFYLPEEMCNLIQNMHIITLYCAYGLGNYALCTIVMRLKSCNAIKAYFFASK